MQYLALLVKQYLVLREGSARNSDLSAFIAFVKGKIKIYIQNSQKLGPIYLW